MIDGVILTPLRQIFDERGKVMHMLREDSTIFTRFGEIYFSCTHPGVVKAWHMHKEMTLNYAVIQGEIKFVLFDDRPDSPTRGEIQEFFISPENVRSFMKEFQILQKNYSPMEFQKIPGPRFLELKKRPPEFRFV